MIFLLLVLNCPAIFGRVWLYYYRAPEPHEASRNARQTTNGYYYPTPKPVYGPPDFVPGKPLEEYLPPVTPKPTYIPPKIEDNELDELTSKTASVSPEINASSPEDEEVTKESPTTTTENPDDDVTQFTTEKDAELINTDEPIITNADLEKIIDQFQKELIKELLTTEAPKTVTKTETTPKVKIEKNENGANDTGIDIDEEYLKVISLPDPKKSQQSQESNEAVVSATDLKPVIVPGNNITSKYYFNEKFRIVAEDFSATTAKPISKNRRLKGEAIYSSAFQSKNNLSFFRLKPNKSRDRDRYRRKEVLPKIDKEAEELQTFRPPQKQTRMVHYDWNQVSSQNRRLDAYDIQFVPSISYSYQIL